MTGNLSTKDFLKELVKVFFIGSMIVGLLGFLIFIQQEPSPTPASPIEIAQGERAQNVVYPRDIVSYRVYFFYRDDSKKCDRDWRKIWATGNQNKFLTVNVVNNRALAKKYEVPSVPYYVVVQNKGGVDSVVLRTNHLSELAEKTRGHR